MNNPSGTYRCVRFPTRFASWRREAHDYFFVQVRAGVADDGNYQHAFNLRARTQKQADAMLEIALARTSLTIERLRLALHEVLTPSGGANIGKQGVQ